MVLHYGDLTDSTNLVKIVNKVTLQFCFAFFCIIVFCIGLVYKMIVNEYEPVARLLSRLWSVS